MLKKAERINYFVIFELLKGIKKFPQGIFTLRDLLSGLHSESGAHLLEMTAFSIHIFHVFKSVLQLNHAC